MTKRARRAGGRQDRLAARAAKPVIDPCPPGQSGGQYKPLSNQDLDQIFETSVRLLEELGMGDVPDRLGRDLISAGAIELPNGRVSLPRHLVRQCLDVAAKEFIFHGRDPARSINVGGDRVHFGTGGAAVQALDIDTQHYRPSTLKDLHDFTRLQDTLANVSWFTRCCIATDVPEPYDLDINTAYALLKNTTKPVATAFTLAEHVDPIVEMFDIAAGGPGKFAERPFVKAHISPVISPMRFGEDAVEVVYECVKHNIPMSCITAAQSGATAPATLAGFLTQSLAETLASLVMVNVLKPGHPMVFSNWPLVIDLRTGAFAGGGGEITVLNAASAQLSNWLGLPSGVASSMTDAKAIDAQYGAEKVLSQTEIVHGVTPIAGHSYPASAENCWKADCPGVPNCFLRIMCATSMPSSVAEAERKDLKPFICLVSFLMNLWSCSMMLLRYLTCNISISQNQPFNKSRQFMLFKPARLAPLLSMTTLSGKPLFWIARLKNAVAAASSRCSDSIKSRVLPNLSMAR